MDTCTNEEVNGAGGVCVVDEAGEVNESNGAHDTNGSNGTHGTNGSHGANGPGGMEDLYELLQISSYAGSETIHRIYRFLAARYHPDNPETGDTDMFHKVKTAYDVLSNTERRAKYDATRCGEIRAANPLSKSIDFMDDIEGEINRRLALLAVLYSRRRTSPRYPEVSLMEIETFMGFPRDYLDFTTWYLVKKGFVHQADNADYTLTVSGVDYVESQRANLPILNRLLTNGQFRSTVHPVERRWNGVDRRMNLPDDRQIRIERRMNKSDRRVNPTDMRDIKLSLYELD
ncbi:MAG: DnaJ domain-containing protein [Terracidiphilus sp.]